MAIAVKFNTGTDSPLHICVLQNLLPGFTEILVIDITAGGQSQKLENWNLDWTSEGLLYMTICDAWLQRTRAVTGV